MPYLSYDRPPGKTRQGWPFWLAFVGAYAVGIIILDIVDDTIGSAVAVAILGPLLVYLLLISISVMLG